MMQTTGLGECFVHMVKCKVRWMARRWEGVRHSFKENTTAAVALRGERKMQRAGSHYLRTPREGGADGIGKGMIPTEKKSSALWQKRKREGDGERQEYMKASCTNGKVKTPSTNKLPGLPWDY